MKKILFASLVLVCLSVLDLDARKKAKHVVMIGVDGWAAEAVRRAPAEDLPNLHYLMEHGAWTLAKRSVMPSSSAINWASMFNGLPTEQHGFSKYNSKRGTIRSITDNGHGIPPTIFTLIREQKPDAETGIIYDWNGIGPVCDTVACSHHLYCRTYKGAEILMPISGYTALAVSYIKEKKPFFFTFYIGQLDETGHSCGWYGPEYMAKQKEVDAAIGQIISALKDAGIYDDTVMVISSDHGGLGKGHGKFTLEELETPFVVSGRKMRQGMEISAPLMQYDTPAIIADILGIKIPDEWRGRPLRQIYK